jgi:branched-chain amino acid transport system ATP-binding protein
VFPNLAVRADTAAGVLSRGEKQMLKICRAVRYPHSDRQLLFDQQDRDAAPGNVGDQVADLLNNDPGQPFGCLVDHDEFGKSEEITR